MVATSRSAKLLQTLKLRLGLSEIGGECIVALNSTNTSI
jgi:hypothetical protein